MDAKDKSDPEQKSSALEASEAPRTNIDDLTPREGELSEEEADKVAGGLVVPAIIATIIPLMVPDTSTSVRAFTTGGNPYPDQDNVKDQ